MKVGICAIIKDCPEKYLQEWINWHRLIGIDHFFIYDNESSTPIKESVGISVTLWEGKKVQLPAYNDCIAKHTDFDWIAFIDDDEFIVVESGNIKTLLANQKSSGLGLNWNTFGAEDEGKSNEPQIKKYTKHIPINSDLNLHIKSIVRPSEISTCANPHFFKYKSGYCADMQGRIVSEAHSKSVTHSGAWINHYYCRSEKEFAEKIKKGRVDSEEPYNMGLYESVNQKATIQSRKIVDIYDKLKWPKVVCMRNLEAENILLDFIAEVNKTHDTSQMTMVEIGSYAGESTIIFARHFKKVISIDPFMDNYDSNDPTCKEAGLPKVYLKFLENTAPYSNIKHYTVTSDEAVKMFKKESIDLVYIDGNHSYPFVKNDIINYQPIVKKNGFITGHDYGLPQIPGVTRAVQELLGTPKVVYLEGSWIHRNKELRKPIVLITPTGGRQHQLELCFKCMLNQTYQGNIIWIIVDDCEPRTSDIIPDKFRQGWEIRKIHPKPLWKEGENTQVRNLQAGIDVAKTIDCDAIFIIEDDDYYSPKYLSVMVSALQGFDVVGESETIYYHVGMKIGYRNKNQQHASLFQTGFTPKMIPVFEQVLKPNVRFVDIDFFKAASNIQFVNNMDLSIGIKGQPGRAGIGNGHSSKYYRVRHDDLTSKQKELLSTIYK